MIEISQERYYQALEYYFLAKQLVLDVRRYERMANMALGLEDCSRLSESIYNKKIPMKKTFNNILLAEGVSVIAIDE